MDIQKRSRAIREACNEENTRLELCFLTKGSLIWDNCREEKNKFYKCRDNAKKLYDEGLLDAEGKERKPAPPS